MVDLEPRRSFDKDLDLVCRYVNEPSVSFADPELNISYARRIELSRQQYLQSVRTIRGWGVGDDVIEDVLAGRVKISEITEKMDSLQ